MPTNSPLIITGMHSSGSDAIAKYLQSAGFYFEEKTNNLLNNFQTKIVRSACKGGHKGIPNWGYTEDLKFDYSKIESYHSEGNSLFTHQQNNLVWHNANCSLTLDFYSSLLPNARFLLVYQNPWEVKQVLLHSGNSTINQNPQYVYDIWHWYNTHLLNFAKANPEKTLLVSANAFIQDPYYVANRLHEKWDYKLDRQKARDYSFYEESIFEKYSEIQLVTEFNSNDKNIALLEALHNISDLKFDSVSHSNQAELLSVVIPCYNQGEFLDEALYSFRTTRNKTGEIIIVNDGSSDSNTIEILDNLKDDNIHVINQTNQGLANARNTGAKASSGKYILFLDADNKVDIKYITEAVKVMEADENIGASYSNPRFFGSNSLMRKLNDFNIDEILCQNYVDACAIVRKEALQQCGGFDANMPVQGYEDWELWINMYKHGWHIHHINKFWFDYRVSSNSMVSTSNQPENREKNMRYLCSKHKEIYVNRADKVMPNMIKKYAILENTCIERQNAIDELSISLSKYQSNPAIKALKNNSTLKKIANLFSK